MTRVWRLCRRRHVAFDGEGARLAGGRWNRRGTPLVYTSATLSLAALEYFVHLDPALAPDDLVAVAADIPDEVGRSRLAPGDLPRAWRRHPPPEALTDLGARWARGMRTAVLVVPSAIIPAEQNYLINPRHPDAARIRRATPEAFRFDPRMWK